MTLHEVTMASLMTMRIFPLVLALAGLLRQGVFSGLYVIGFIVSLWLRRGSKQKPITFAWMLLLKIFLAISLLGCVCQLAFQVTLLSTPPYGHLLDTSNTTSIWSGLGFIRLDIDAGTIVRQILPDVILLLFTASTFLFVRKKLSNTPELECSETYGYRTATQRGIFVYVIMLLLLILVVSFPSIISAVYFLILVSVSIRWAAGFGVMRGYPQSVSALLAFLCCHTTFWYSYQFDIFRKAVPPSSTAARLLGFYYFNEVSMNVPNEYIWPPILCAVLMIVLMILLSDERNDNHCRGLMTSSSGWPTFRSSEYIGRVRTEKSWQWLHRGADYAKYASYALCVIGTMVWTLAFQSSWLDFVILLWWVLAWIVPRKVFLHTIPALVAYMACLLIILYVYSLNGSGIKEYKDVGLFQDIPPYYRLAIRTFLFCLTCFACRYRRHATIPLTSDTVSDRSTLLCRKEGESSPSLQLPHMESLGEEDNIDSQSIKSQSKRWIKRIANLGRICWSIVLEYTMIIALALLYFSGLQRVTILSAGYLFICILFAVFPYLAVCFWIVLVVYAEMAILLVYIWQFDAISSHVSVQSSALFGVDCPSEQHVQSCMIWHLFILLFSLVQMYILKHYKSSYKNRSYSLQMNRHMSVVTLRNGNGMVDSHNYASTHDNWSQNTALFSESDHVLVAAYRLIISWATERWLLLCYLVFLLVSLVGSHVTMINTGYLVFFSVCMLIHQTAHHRKPLRILFWVIAIYAGLALAVLYLYQFDSIAQYLHRIASVETLGAIGLAKQHSTGSLFTYLIGSTSVLVVVVLQVRIFRDNIHPRNFRLDILNHPGFMFAVVPLTATCDFVRKALIAHSHKLTMVAIFAAVSSQPFFSNVALLFLAILDLLFLPKRNLANVIIGGFISLVASLCCWMKLLFQIPFFSSSSNTEWFGLEKVSDYGSYVSAYVCVIIAVAIERQAHRWGKRVTSEENHDPCNPYLLFDNQDRRNQRSSSREKSSFHIHHAFAYIVDYAFFLHGVSFIQVLAVITAFIHLDIVGLVYFVLFVLVPLPRSLRYWRALNIVVAVLIMVQFLILVGLAPSLSVQYPWQSWSTWKQGLAIWLYLPVPGPWSFYWLPHRHAVNLASDFTLLVFLSLQSFVLFLQQRNTAFPRISLSRPRTLGELYRESVGRDKLWNDLVPYLRFWTLRYFHWIVVTFTFIAGVVKFDILSFFYILWSFYFFSLGESFLLSERRRKHWNYLRYFNIGILAVRITYQLPAYIINWDTANTSVVDLVKFLGVQKGLSYDSSSQYFFNAWSVDGAVLDIFMYALLLMQYCMLRSDDMKDVLCYLKEDYDRAHERQIEIARLELVALNTVRQRDINHRERVRQRIEFLYKQDAVLTLADSSTIFLNEKKDVGIEALYSAILKRRQILEAEKTSVLTDEVRSLSESMQDETSSKKIRAYFVRFIDWITDGLYQLSKSYRYRAIRTTTDDDVISLASTKLSFESSVRLGSLPTVPIATVAPICKDEDLNSVSDPASSRKNSLLMNADQSSSSIDTSTVVADNTVVSSVCSDEHTNDSSSQDASDNGSNEQPRSRVLEMFRACYYVFVANTMTTTLLLMIINHMVNRNLMSCVYPIIAFTVATMMRPRPSPTLWKFLIIYTEIVICVKYFFQFSFFTFNDDYLFMSWIRVVGINKLSYGSRFSTVILDLLMLFAVVAHRTALLRQGLWTRHKMNQRDIDDYQMESGGSASAGFPDSGDLDMMESSVVDDDTPAYLSSNVLATHVTIYPGSSTNDIHLLNVLDSLPGGDDKKSEYQAVSQNDASSDERTPCMTNDSDHDENIVNDNDKSCYCCCSGPLMSLLDTSSVPPKDMYTIMFVFDLIVFIISLFGWGSFGNISSNADDNIGVYLSENRVPMGFLLFLLIQFIFIMIDRCIYLNRSLPFKLALHILEIILVHLLLFFILPLSYNEADATKYDVVLLLWYFFKSIYFLISAYQMKHGYPTRVSTNFLFRGHSRLNSIFFYIFRAIPFVYELRNVLDWSCTPTTLGLFSWLKMEDIYANLFLIKVQYEADKCSSRKIGDRQNMASKFWMGTFLVIVLCFVLWFPLLIISLSNVSSEPHPVIEMNLVVSINGYQPLFIMNSERNSVFNISTEDVTSLREEYGPDFRSQYNTESARRIELLPDSKTLWGISPPSFANLTNLLNDTVSNNVILRTDWSFKRNYSKFADQTVSGYYTNRLNSTVTRQLFDMLSSNSTQSVEIPFSIPPVWRAPAKGSAKYIVDDRHFGTLCLSFTTDSDIYSALSFWGASEFTHTARRNIEIYIFSENVSNETFSVFAGVGIIGLYISVVLVIGRFLRLLVANISHRIMFDNLPNPDMIMLLCDDIYMTRSSNDLVLEELLFNELIKVYRSSETLISWTQPTRKSKID